ncbi:TPA: hypothetical protein ACLA05_001024, partial [Neisseria meningitidis]
NKFQSVRKWNLSAAARQNHTLQNLTIRRGRKPEAFLFRRKILISPPCSRSRSKGKKFTRFLSVKNYQIKQIL